MGPTFFLYPRVLADIFSACGYDLNREVDLIRLDPMYRLVFEDGGPLVASGDMTKLAAEVARFSPKDAANLPRFMADNRAKLAAFKPILEAPFHSARDLLRPDVLRSLKQMRPHRTVDSDLATYFDDERVRLAFSFQSKYLGMSPFPLPQPVHHPVVHGVRVRRVPSPRRLRRGDERDGADRPRPGGGFPPRHPRAGDPVPGPAPPPGCGPPTASSSSTPLVINADFAQTMAKLVPDALRRRWTDRKLAAKKYSCSTFMMYLGIEGDLGDLAHHTIFLSRDYRRNVREIEEGRAPPGEPSLYVQNATVTDPELAPSGHSTLYVLVPVGHRVGEGIDWATLKPGYRAMVLQRLEALGIHDIERRIRFERITTPTDWEADLDIYRGATFNLAHSLRQMLHLRPRNRFEDLDGVYLVGRRHPPR